MGTSGDFGQVSDSTYGLYVQLRNLPMQNSHPIAAIKFSHIYVDADMSTGPKHVFCAVQEDAILMTIANVLAIISSLFCQNHSRAKEKHGMLNTKVASQWLEMLFRNREFPSIPSTVTEIFVVFLTPSRNM